jgi:hypothetical protein
VETSGISRNPLGLQIATAAGCTQCHNPLFNNGRAVMGAIDADFEWFKGIVYTHTTALPQTRVLLEGPPLERLAMGSFSRHRLPESRLGEVWNYIADIGFRARMHGQLSAGVESANGVTYTLDVENTGVEDRGLTAEDVTITLRVPTGTSVIAATGAGYQGVRPDEQEDADVALWRAPRMAPGDHRTHTITLSRAATATNNLRGRINCTRPVVKTGPTDSQDISPPPRAQTQ